MSFNSRLARRRAPSILATSSKSAESVATRLYSWKLLGGAKAKLLLRGLGMFSSLVLLGLISGLGFFTTAAFALPPGRHYEMVSPVFKGGYRGYRFRAMSIVLLFSGSNCFQRRVAPLLILALICCLSLMFAPLGAVGSALAAAPETPEMREATEVTATAAMFHGVLNPGAPGEVGTYEFVYKASDNAECEGGGEATVPPGLSLGGGKEEVLPGNGVWA